MQAKTISILIEFISVTITSSSHALHRALCTTCISNQWFGFDKPIIINFDINTNDLLRNYDYITLTIHYPSDTRILLLPRQWFYGEIMTSIDLMEK